jgi:hypothetical protein
MFLIDTFTEVRTGKRLFCAYSVQSGLKKGDTSSPLLFNFALECDMKKAQENKEGLELNGTRQLPIYTDVFGVNLGIIKKTQKLC